jgi:signal transduction histidine kinase
VKRIKCFMIIFFICLSIPLGYFILRTHQSLEQEEAAELRFFADTLFYEMEKELSDLVLKEEGRAIEEYSSLSALSALPKEDYILGYFQNNPDGSFRTPLAPDDIALSDSKKQALENKVIVDVVSQLEEVNQAFNARRTEVPEPLEVSPPEKILPEKEEGFSLSGRYLDLSRSKQKKGYLGQETKRVENITKDQAIKLSKQDISAPESYKSSEKRLQEAELSLGKMDENIADTSIIHGNSVSNYDEYDKFVQSDTADGISAPAPSVFVEKNTAGLENGRGNKRGEDASVFRVEVDPLQSVFISDEKAVFFRRIVIDNRVYRQGFVLLIQEFLNHLSQSHFSGQPMSQFTNLKLSIRDGGKRRIIISSGALSENPEFSLNHTFPRPFAFLDAHLTCDHIPRSTGRQTLNIMMSIMAMVILMGLFAIYRSVYSIVSLSERRSQFVSSVTHELKTPLTNIRMYVEMLEQGIASSPEREQDYFRVLCSESRRLGRLINNVLEYSRLEKKNRQLELSVGDFNDVISEVNSIMGEKLRQEGFVLYVKNDANVLFMYDREVMIQVLINLIENSMKFGKHNAEKEILLLLEPEEKHIRIRLSDTGPGIPKNALKKVFDDFFRVDNELTRTTGGTGIGLSLVRKFLKAMGGKVEAKNNKGPGCTITMYLPRTKS